MPTIKLLAFSTMACLLSRGLCIRQRRGRLEYLGGHTGLSELQAISGQQSQPMDFLPFTIMRSPNERMVSFWAYLMDIQKSRGLPGANISEWLPHMLSDSMYRLLAPAGSNLKDVTATMEAIKDYMIFVCSGGPNRAI